MRRLLNGGESDPYDPSGAGVRGESGSDLRALYWFGVSTKEAAAISSC